MADESKHKPGLRAYLAADFALFRKRFARAREWFAGHYFDADLRTLAVFRIILGALLSGDCLRHWYYARDYYSNEGLLSNHFHLFRPSGEFNFSLFHAFSTLGEVHAAFALSLACYLLLLVGWRTRLFSVLSCVWVTSMDNRLVLVENGGYVVVNLMAFWSMFMPIGKRFSVDSLLESFRHKREASLEHLNERSLPASLTAPFRSTASFLLLANFAVIYVFNAVNKYGMIWRKGLTVWYVLHIDRMATGIAVFVREQVPYWATWLMSHATLVIEAVIVMTILWPRGRRWSRPLAMVLVLLLHTSFGVVFRLGPFSWFMIGWSSVLMMPVHWEALARWYRARAVPTTVLFDPSSGLGFQLARLVSRLDRTSLVTFAASEAGPWLAVEARGARHDGHKALLAITRALPAGRWLLPASRVVSLGLLDAAFVVVARHHAWIGRVIGAASLADARPKPASGLHGEDAQAGLAAWWGRWRRRLREAVLVYLLLSSVSQALNENKSIPEPLKHTQPKVVRATMGYPRIFQGWGMFSPNPVQEDGYLTVDAVTIDGRHVDPFTGVEPDMNLSDARGMAAGQIVQDYANRIRLDQNRPFRKGLTEWISRHHVRTGRQQDEIVAFNAYWLRDQNPEPGFLVPTDHEQLCIASWRKARHRPAPGLEPLPPLCTVVSAESRKEEVKPAAEVN